LEASVTVLIGSILN